MTRSRSYSTDVVVAAIRGYVAGRSQRDIASVLGVPRTTVREWIHDFLSERVTIPDEPHVHTWRIATPAGPRSDGVCLGCFEERVFSNTMDRHTWGRGGRL